MSTHKDIDKICCVVLVFTLVFSVLFMNAGHFGVQKASVMMGYENTLFDTSRVHTINIVMEDWDEFTVNCKNEEYYECTVVIDNEAYKNVAIRGKGNTSLTQVESYGNNRYSFKIEFDHYDSANTYYGLDKLCLNNIIQDNTYMKDYLTYQMMNEMGVKSPLCSYVYITVNGEEWGLYLAVEGVEESFLQRNYGSHYGQLYKPDSTSMGGGRGNGVKFDMDEFLKSSDDVLLKYIDDEIESYPNIFNNAKTSVSDADKTRLIEALKKLNSGEELESVVDIDSVIYYFVVHNFVLNFDSYTGRMIHNYYLYEKDGQMQMIPWDYNLAFGGFQSIGDATSLVNYPIDTPVSGGNAEDRPMIAWIFENEEYTELYHKYFSEFISKYFDSGYFEKMIDGVTAMISPYVEKDSIKFCTYEEFETGAATLKEFCLLRAESVRGQLNGTIGMTFDTQENDTLIDAGDIRISDMGSMDNSMGAGGIPVANMQNPQGHMENNAIQQFPSSDGYPLEAPPGGFNVTENKGTGDDFLRQMPDGEMQGRTPPDGNRLPNDSGRVISRTQTVIPDSSWILMGVSVLVLTLGLGFALVYKRRK